MAAELANALWNNVRSRRVAPNEAPELLEQVLTLYLRWADDEALAVRALGIAVSLNHPAYDCVYLALAHHVDGTLVTADTRFADKVAGTEHADRVALLAEFAPA